MIYDPVCMGNTRRLGKVDSDDPMDDFRCYQISSYSDFPAISSRVSGFPSRPHFLPPPTPTFKPCSSSPQALDPVLPSQACLQHENQY
jgi:hypothetical protein